MRACKKLGKRLLMSGYRNETHVFLFVLTETSQLVTISPHSINCSTPTSRGNAPPPSPASCSGHSAPSTPGILHGRSPARETWPYSPKPSPCSTPRKQSPQPPPPTPSSSSRRCTSNRNRPTS